MFIKNMTSVLSLASNKFIGDNYPTFIIAEIGQNHQGDLNTAKELIKIAKECGADCVKFQKSSLSAKFNKAALERPYDSPHSWGITYGDHKQYLEFSNEQFINLQNYAKHIGIVFTASAMDFVALEFLHDISVPFIKIGSGDANNFILIREAAKKNIPLIISTGMQDLKTVETIYEIVSEYHKNFALLHCVSAYPTPIHQLNLNVIKLYKNKFPDINIGYSGHELGSHLTLTSVALGAKIIERHLTLDKNLKGSDHKCSLNPQEFAQLVKHIREFEIALGEPKKYRQKCELNCYEKLGKTLVFSKDLNKDHKICANDLWIKVAEPKGIDGTLIETIIGKKLTTSVKQDESVLEIYFQ